MIEHGIDSKIHKFATPAASAGERLSPCWQGAARIPSRQVLAEQPEKVLTLLMAVARHPEIREALERGGYSDADHAEGWELLRRSCAWSAPASTDPEPMKPVQGQSTAEPRHDSTEQRRSRAKVGRGTAEVGQSTAEPLHDSTEQRQSRARVGRGTAELRRGTAEGQCSSAEVRQSTAEVRQWVRTHFGRLQLALEHRHPQLVPTLFAGIEKPLPKAAVLALGTLLGRLDASERSQEPSPVLETLARRGLDGRERERLAALCRSAMRAPLGEAEDTQQEARRAVLQALHAWRREWSATARALLVRKELQIALGIAKRSKNGGSEGGGANAPSDVPPSRDALGHPAHGVAAVGRSRSRPKIKPGKEEPGRSHRHTHSGAHRRSSHPRGVGNSGVGTEAPLFAAKSAAKAATPTLLGRRGLPVRTQPPQEAPQVVLRQSASWFIKSPAVVVRHPGQVDERQAWKSAAPEQLLAHWSRPAHSPLAVQPSVCSQQLVAAQEPHALVESQTWLQLAPKMVVWQLPPVDPPPLPVAPLPVAPVAPLPVAPLPVAPVAPVPPPLACLVPVKVQDPPEVLQVPFRLVPLMVPEQVTPVSGEKVTWFPETCTCMTSGPQVIVQESESVHTMVVPSQVSLTVQLPA